ncbi:marine proteobacterial sortase target protein [Corallincola luteus]|uniref:Marine proteobacterial sortase target protein n=1 Tax=Corallincola luteus TaxID=1775177 RepID=A0ABY2AGX0_9GAMM|nr:marine proteobacterial sortase target protein [Corallincola luteus]TCI01804.1 marine proteobacterial sortase target protein [Corallincola luteus]
MLRSNLPPHQVILDRPLPLKRRHPQVSGQLFHREVVSTPYKTAKRVLGFVVLAGAAVVLLLTLGRAEAASMAGRTSTPVGQSAISIEGDMDGQAGASAGSGDSLPAVLAPRLNEDDIKAPQLMLQQPGRFTQAVMLSSELDLDISGMIVKATLKQRFKNTTDDWLEGLYLLPLPENSAVNRMTMQVGDRIIEGEIKEKQQAKQLFEQARKSGKRASLLVQRRPNMFSNKVTNIAPGEEVIVTISFLQQLDYRDGEFQLRFPMTITPRYSPGVPLADIPAEETNASVDLSGDFSWALPTTQVPDAVQISPYMFSRQEQLEKLLNPIQIRANIDPGMPLAALTSDSHQLIVSEREGQYRVGLTSPQVSMDRDFLLRWQPKLGSEPKAALFTQEVDGDSYGLLMLMPPANVKSADGQGGPQSGQAMAKEMIFVIDTSGSMAGEPIRQAKQSLMTALTWLRPQDSFNLIQFNSSTSMLFPQAMPANDAALQHARQYVQRLDAGGGTEMMSALRAALNNQSQGDEQGRNAVRQVVFITDGSVGNEQALFQHIHQNLSDSRLFTVGIGAAPNSYFMRKAAEFGRGSYTYISNVQQVQGPMSSLFKRLSSPVADGIQLQWQQGIDADVYPRRIPTLYLNEPLLISFKANKLDGQLVISGHTAKAPWRRELSLARKGGSDGVSTLWARSKIEALMDEKVAGADKDEIREQVLSVALTHQLVSSYTSFIAVEKTPVRPMDQLLTKAPVPNVQPQGQAAQSFAVPKTATGADFKLWIGLLVFLCSLFALMRLNQQQERSDNLEAI